MIYEIAIICLAGYGFVMTSLWIAALIGAARERHDQMVQSQMWKMMAEGYRRRYESQSAVAAEDREVGQ